MKSAWVEREAKQAVDRYGKAGIAADLALRLYSTRLLGRDPKLVLHGGGNSSLKTTERDLAGEKLAVLRVKGSGWDMGAIEPGGFPAVRLEPLRALRARKTLSDDAMARVQRAYLIDPQAPSPSVEMLLHAFMPAKFIDHTHSTAVLSLIDQPNAAELCAEAFGGRLGFVRYRMPGFGLAKEAAAVFDKNPKVEGLILDKHGIFTFGADARESYERMIAFVSRAENRLRRQVAKRVRGCETAATHRRRDSMSRRSCAASARCAMPAAKARTNDRSSRSAPAMRSSISSTARMWRATPAPA